MADLEATLDAGPISTTIADTAAVFKQGPCMFIMCSFLEVRSIIEIRTTCAALRTVMSAWLNDSLLKLPSNLLKLPSNRALIQVLGKLSATQRPENTTSINLLSMCLHDRSSRVRQAAAEALGRTGSGCRCVADNVLDMLAKESDTLASFEAVVALAQIAAGDEQMVDKIAQCNFARQDIAGVVSTLFWNPDARLTVQENLGGALCALVRNVDQSASLRCAGIRALATLMNKDKILCRTVHAFDLIANAVAACLNDCNSNVCKAAIEVLKDIPSGTPNLTRELTRYLEESHFVDAAALLALEKIAPLSAETCDAGIAVLLASCIRRGNQEVRHIAEDVLRRNVPKGDEGILQLLQNMVYKSGDCECHTAILGLLHCASHGDAASSDCLVACLVSERPPRIRVSALEVLAQIVHESDDRMVRALEHALVDANSDVRKGALLILRSITNPNIEECLLLALLPIPTDPRKFWVIDALGSRERWVNDVHVQHSLTQCLSGQDAAVRRHTLQVLLKICGSFGPGLCSFCVSDIVRMDIGEHCPERFKRRELLRQIVGHNYHSHDFNVRSSALHAIMEISSPGERDAIQAVITCLSDADFNLRRLAARSLGQLADQGTAEEIRRALEAAAGDEDNDVRINIGRSLVQINRL